MESETKVWLSRFTWQTVVKTKAVVAMHGHCWCRRNAADLLLCLDCTNLHFTPCFCFTVT